MCVRARARVCVCVYVRARLRASVFVCGVSGEEGGGGGSCVHHAYMNVIYKCVHLGVGSCKHKHNLAVPQAIMNTIGVPGLLRLRAREVVRER